jgi:RHS repeat-associated protein
MSTQAKLIAPTNKPQTADARPGGLPPLISRAGVILCLLLILCCAPVETARAQNCQSCGVDDKPVKVGFYASACSSQGYNVTLNGTTVSGSGSCTANTWVSTSKAFTYLKPDVTYQVTAGTGSCSTHIVFDVPDKYHVEIDGVETNVIDKVGAAKGGGDGVWNVVIRKCKSCGQEAAQSCGIDLNSVNWSVGMGRLSDGRSAEAISIQEDTLSSAIYTPATLVYTPPGQTTEVDVVRAADGSLRQVKSPQALADVVTISGSEYDIRFYQPSDVGSKVNGVYQVSNQPLTVWKIKNPDPTTTSRFQIIKIQGGTTLETNEYDWDAVSNNWSLNRGNGASIKTKSITYPTTTSRIETSLTKESIGQVVSKVTRTYHTYAWGEDLLKEVVDPDGAALTTVYSYYENSGEPGRYAHLQSVTYPDGSWEKYDYDGYGNRVLILRPWKDQSIGTTTEANGYATRYTFSNFDGLRVSLYPTYISSIEEKVAGTTVRKTTFTRSNSLVNGEPAVTETQTLYTSSSSSLTSSKITYHSTASTFFANRLVSAVNPDGTKDSYTYEKGTYTSNADPSLNQFTPDPNGTYTRTTVVHGTDAAPDGVAFKTTKETSVSDVSGHALFREVYVYDGAAYQRVIWAVMSYDSRGHLTQTTGSNNQVTTAAWNGDLLTSQVDEVGVETDYTYDSLNRVKTQIKKGVAASGQFPAQGDITTTYTYDAASRRTGETRTAGTLTLSSSTAYDRAGRLKSETAETGLATAYSYSNGGRTQTITLPGGTTRFSDNYLDGQPKSVTGTSVVAQYFDYGVNADGTRYTQAFSGGGGLASPRWTKTTADWLGRTVQAEAPAFGGGTLVHTYTYNGKGQLQAESLLSGTSKLIGDKLYEYEETGNLSRMGQDRNGDGLLTPASTDRILEITDIFKTSDNSWFRSRTVEAYLNDNDSTKTKLQEQQERMSNFSASGTEKTISDTSLEELGSVTTDAVTSVDRAAKKMTVTTTVSGSNVSGVSVSVNGLLQSSTPTTPQAATTYGYDALGRRVGITSPVLGTTTQTYDPATGQVVSLSDQVHTTTLDYYPATVANAGRLKSQADSAGKKVYFNYNGLGELIQTWGGTTYPQEYVYDPYGQRTELHTFRGGSNWQSSAWPQSTAGTADVTRWVYQDSTGLLLQKQDAANKQVAFGYDSMGRIATRTWARTDALGNPLVTTYSYDPASGEVSGISYSDSTPAVSMNFDRAGRATTISDSAGARARTFNAGNDLLTEQISGGILDGLVFGSGYDNLLRRSSLVAGSNGTSLVNQTYGYDPSSRLSTISAAGQTATHNYNPTTGLLGDLTYSGGTTVSRAYDAVGRLGSITTTPPAGGTQSYTYIYNGLDQRTRVTREDGSYKSYSYSDRGEVTSEKRFWSDNSPVAGQQFEYGFDNIGNRSSARSGGDPLGGGLRQSDYQANTLNQYTQRTVPGAYDVSGTANTAATVTVNTQTTTRKNDYFNQTQNVNNSAAPVYAQTDVLGVKGGGGPNGEDSVAQQSGRVYVPKALELYTYDADGNLAADGRWNYTWDAENRLSSMETIPAAPVEAKKRLEFSYDYMGRRIQKKVYSWNASLGSYQLQAVTKFVYDDWKVIAELDGNNALVRSYTWGPTGLLLVKEGGVTYQVGYDGNLNVTSLVNSATGTVAASYDYDPFGNTLKAVGDYAAKNPIRFSSEYEDGETGLIYYGRRYYNSQTGRWLSRDPSGEDSGVNLYGFLDNDGINDVDYLGLWRRDSWSGGWYRYNGHATAEKCDKLSDLARLITGDENDWHLLRSTDRVREGEVVDITPLLKNLETRLRSNVRRDTRQFRAYFPGPDHEPTGWLISGASQAEAIGRFFDRGQPLGSVGCDDASTIILSQALINVIGPSLYDQLLEQFNSDVLAFFISRQGKISTMLIGDRGWIPNYAEYQGLPNTGDYGHENSIKVDRNLYFGHPLGRFTKQKLERILQDAYVDAGGARRRDRIPGFRDEQDIEITFIDVAKVFGAVFDIRREQGR